ncbi:MAG: hypothetical protein NZ484_01135 [Patescibacteria group bacterium]|nr:hypothetical protein [Patescibacteria group bacterium]MCX7589734.1 hypothetical protein [Patescibacteria group bacterium]MDW8279907.1 hypothetical protein [bacterium]
MKKILFGILIIIIVFLGYAFNSISCMSLPNYSFLKYIYNLKCSSNNINDSTINIPSVSTSNNQLITQSNQNQNNNTQEQKIKKISDSKIINYTIDSNNQIIAVNNLGQIIKISNQEEIINDTIKDIPNNVLFSKDNSKIIFALNNFINIFNIKNQTWKQIPNASNPTISEKNKLAYLVKNNGINSIYLLDLNKENSTPNKLIDLNILDFKLIWKDDLNLFIVSNPSSLNVGQVLLINIKDKTIKLVYELQGIDFNWDEKTNHGLLFYSNQAGMGGSLYLVDNNFENKKFSFTTILSKCVFNQTIFLNQQTSTAQSTTTNNYIFCAVPINQDELQNKFIIDDYLTYNLYTEDEIYKINIQNKSIEKIKPENNNQFFDIQELKIKDNKIFFINRFDNNLYSIEL